MSFKLRSPYDIDWTPVYRTLDEDGILGLANKNGTIRVHKDLKSPQIESTIRHEKCHIDDIKKGLLWYDNEYIYSRKNTNSPWKKTKRGPDVDGASYHEHEKKAKSKE